MSIDSDDYFSIIRFLGKGSFGSVYLAETKSLLEETSIGTLVAIKMINLEKIPHDQLPFIDNEIAVLERLSTFNKENNRRLIRYYGSIKLNRKGNSYYIIIMEYINGYLMMDYINSLYRTRFNPSIEMNIEIYILKEYFSDDEIVSILRDLSETLAFIHSADVVHRDIKIDNIMFDLHSERKFKFIDFGLACINLTERGNIRGLGTPQYAAPELFKLASEKVDRQIKSLEDIEMLKKADVWALGIVFFIFVNGIILFESEDETIKELVYMFNIELEIPEFKGDIRINNVLKRMLIKDYKKRASAEEIYEILS